MKLAVLAAVSLAIRSLSPLSTSVTRLEGMIVAVFMFSKSQTLVVMASAGSFNRGIVVNTGNEYDSADILGQDAEFPGVGQPRRKRLRQHGERSHRHHSDC